MGNEVYTGEYEDGGDGFVPGELVEPEEDGDGGGHEGLGVVVHAEGGGADALEGYGDEEVSEEGGAEDDVEEACQGGEGGFG